EKVGQDFDTSDYYTIEEVNTRFDLTNEEIALKADKTVTDSLGNRLSDTESKLTVQAGQITSAVSTANTALANYNNLQLGGRNYIIGSNQMIERSDDSPGNKWFTNVSLSPAFFEDCQGVPILLSMDLMSEDVVHGEKPSVSVVITYEYEDGVERQYTWNWQHLAKAGINPWKRYTGSGAIPADALRVTGLMVTLQGGFTSGYIAIRNPKIERGNKMTAYTKAPEDEENRLSTAESRITQNATSITSAVSNASAALSGFNNLQIGGRNYMLKTMQTLTVDAASPMTLWMSGIAMSPDFLAECKGKQVYFSFYLRWENVVRDGTNIPWVGMQVNYELDGGGTSYNAYSVGSYLTEGSSRDWLRYSIRYTVPSNAVRVSSAMATIQRVGGLVELRCPMVEKSSKLSDYSPAPEDADNRLTLAESRITQNATNINLKVSQSIYNTEKIYRSVSAPASPSVNMLWLNTGVSPYVINRWTGSAWVTVGADKVIASGINITPNDITLRTTNFILQLLDKNNPENVLMDMRADGNVGFKQLFAEQVVSNSVVEAYNGSTMLYVYPAYTGTSPNYFKSIREACEFLSGKYLRETVYVTFATSTTENIYENAGIVLKGVCGPGRIWFNFGGKNKTIIGNLYIDSCAIAIFIDGLNIRESRPLNGGSRNPAVVYAHHCTHVTLQHVIINGNNTSEAAYRADYTNASIWDGVLRNVTTGFHMNSSMGVVESTTGTLTYAMLCNAGIIYCVGTVPSGSRITQKNGVIYASGISTGTNTNPGTVTTELTANFTASLTRSYRSGVWRTDTYDMVQGAYNDAGYTSSVGWNYGCCWFGSLRSALSGRTVRSATLTITRLTGSGSGGSVYMYLYGISNTTNSGTPSLTYSVGNIGFIARGQTLQITLPNALVQGLANGTYGGLCIYEGAYNFGRSAYSSNYSRYSAPSLYVVYS
ncbi:hypothetical protein LJC74_08850, partial [Eubacteriales bacterium OttesenSCG-928-A19]|nr:hypothetical protein [Eubacteriales bacterium OttesenSCG-928-A19]